VRISLTSLVVQNLTVHRWCTAAGDVKLGIPRGGYGALFAGLNGSLLKFIPATAVQFMCYSQVRDALSLRVSPVREKYVH
jgi:hypothetical protein